MATAGRWPARAETVCIAVLRLIAGTERVELIGERQHEIAG